MKPSSSIATFVAMAAAVAASPAFARSSAFTGPAVTSPSNAHVVRMGPPRGAATLGRPRRDHDRRWANYGAVSPTVIVTPGAPAPATATPLIVPVIPTEASASASSCFHPRVIEVSPAAASDAPLPRVVYGSPPPCRTRAD